MVTMYLGNTLLVGLLYWHDLVDLFVIVWRILEQRDFRTKEPIQSKPYFDLYYKLGLTIKRGILLCSRGN